MAPKARLHVLKADDDKANNPVSDDWLQTDRELRPENQRQCVDFQQQLGVRGSKRLPVGGRQLRRGHVVAGARRPAGDLRVSGRQLRAGTDNGLNASPGTISAPGTAKNVITVGAIETGRNIEGEAITSVTNTVTEIDEDGEEIEKR